MSDQVELLEIEDWKQRAERATEASTDLDAIAPLKSRLIEVKAVEDEERVLEFIISDGGVDRERDVINPKGWDLKSFKKNPVVLWAHESWSPPIGRAVAIWRDDEMENQPLISRCEFCDPDMNPMGDMVYRMLLGKFLRATSVGFKPAKWRWVDSEGPEERRGGIDFEKQELLEYSVVPIPANPRALMRGAKGLPLGMDLMAAHAAGVDTSPLRIWCEKKLDRAEPLKGLAPSDVEDAWKATSPRKLVVDLGAVAKGWVAESKIFEAPDPEVVEFKIAAPEGLAEEITQAAAYRAWRELTGCPEASDFGKHLAELVRKANQTEEQVELRVQRVLCSPMSDDLRKALEPTLKRDPSGGWLVMRGAIAVGRTKDPASIRFHEDGSIFLDPEPAAPTKTVAVDPEALDDYVIELPTKPSPKPAKTGVPISDFAKHLRELKATR